MDDELVNKIKEKIEKTISVYKKELTSLRAGRANPQLLDRILVDYYGTPTPITQLGNIAVPEPRMIAITLWDTSALSSAEKAILKSDLGINPTNDGKVIRLVFPELTEERRRELVKVVRKKGEECKVAIRSIRREAMEGLQKELKAKTMTEDDVKLYEKEIQKVVDEYIKTTDVILSEKEKEIIEV
jgi:ribosome recycling factor